MRTQSELRKEQKRAISVFFDKMQNFDHYIPNSYMVNKHGDLLPSGFTATSQRPFVVSDLPREAHWGWNQSSCKQTIRIENRILVTFRKICVKRKTSATLPVPSYKVWIFDIEYNEFEPHQYLLWCEKGHGVDTDLGMIFPAELTIQELSFLKPFVEETLARELGW